MEKQANFNFGKSNFCWTLIYTSAQKTLRVLGCGIF